jgi:hypothetical protein
MSEKTSDIIVHIDELGTGFDGIEKAQGKNNPRAENNRATSKTKEEKIVGFR